MSFRMKVTASCVAVFSVLALLVLTREPAPRRDGDWDVTMVSDLPGAKPAAPITFTLCKTKEEAEDPEKLIPLTGRGEKDNNEKQATTCTVSDQKLDGATVTWTARCEGLNPMTGTGEFVYSTDRFVGTMKVVTSRDGQPFTITNKYTGTRRGDCVM